jgi:Ca2+-binding RTX toxin-like protein
MPDAPDGENLIQNGSFEDITTPDRRGGSHHHHHHHHSRHSGRGGAEVLGWQVADGPGPDVISSPWRPAADGQRFIELDGSRARDTNSAIYQDVPTTDGGTFLLSFSYAAPAFSRAQSNGIEVLWDGQVIDVITADGGRGMDWQTFTYELEGAGDATRLEFRAVGTDDGRGGYIDNVSLVETAPPPLFTDEADTVVLADDDPDYGSGGPYDALGGDDTVTGGDQDDEIFGNTGNDTLLGGAGDDILIGGADGEVLVEREVVIEHDLSGLSEAPAPGIDPAHFQLAADHKVTLSFVGEEAGYRNTLGLYKIGPSGEITDVEIVFQDASQGRWGGLEPGTDVELDLAAGEEFGLFIIADGADRNSFRRFDDGHFEFRNADGSPATVASDAPQLVFVDDHGRVKELNGNVYHSAATAANPALNGDDALHVTAAASGDGGLRIAFEDLSIPVRGRWGRGEPDFDDLVVDLHFEPVTETVIEAASDDDWLEGGDGKDTLIGGFGDDHLEGGAGQDRLEGGKGRDELFGNGGDDVLIGGGGKDKLVGGGGDDLLKGGAGADVLKGGNGDDVLIGGNGDDRIDGGAGDDLVRFDFGDGENETADGGLGTDTLAITVETDDLQDPAVVQALVDLSSFVLANADAGTDSGPTAAFAALGLEVGNFEAIDITVIDSETGEEVPGFLTPAIALSVIPAAGEEDTAIALAISAAVTNAPELFELSVTVSGLPAGATLSAGSDNGDGSYTLAPADLAGLTLTPPPGDAEDIALTVSATATSLVTGLVTQSAPETLAVEVEAVADTPVLSVADAQLADAGAGDDTLTGTDGKDTLQGFGGNDTLTGGAGGDRLIGDGAATTLTAALSIAAALGDLDGSESLSITVSGLPAGASLSAGTDLGAGSVRLTAAELAGLTLSAPAGIGDFTLNVTATATDTDPDSGAESTAESIASADIQVLASVDGDDLIFGGTGKDEILGGGGNDVIFGDGGADDIDAGAGDDTVSGGAGSDVIFGGDGADTIDGDGGNDVIDGGAGNDTLAGSGGDDWIIGGAGADQITGGGGLDLLDGGEGDDTLKGGKDADTLLGGDGNDTLLGNGGDNVLDGGAGDDVLVTADGADTLSGGDGNDTLTAGAGGDVLTGGAGDDVVDGRAGDDSLSGGLGADRLLAGGGDDWADGGDGDDIVFGGGGADTLLGGDGDDALSGEIGADWLSGGAGHDTIEGGGGQDQLFGDAGNDHLYGDDGADRAEGGDGDDRVWGGAGADELFGDAGNDILYGGDDADVLHGGLDNDTVRGEQGNDDLYGDEGNDILIGAEGKDRLFGGGGNDVLIGEEGADQLFGEDGNDNLLGGGGADTLDGGAGNDRLEGQGGGDRLIGGEGVDFMVGGGGSDSFVFDLSAAQAESGIGAGNRDTIKGFEADGASSSPDVIEFTGIASFSFVGDEAQAFAGGGAASGRFNSQTKILELDADGDSTVDMEIELLGVDIADLDDTDFTVS